MHWTPEEILEISRNYQRGCVLAAGAELGLFDLLAQKKLPLDEICAALGADTRAMEILADALTAIGLLQKDAGSYWLSAGVADSLSSNGKHSILAMVLHQANCLRRWSELAKTVKFGRPEQVAPSIRGAQGDLESFIGAMDNVSAPVAEKVIGDLKLSGVTHVLDVGGASGTWTIAWLELYPAARATIFDLPPVIEMARRRISHLGLSSRVDFAAGNYLLDEFPQGADVIWASAIAHQQSRAENRRLYRTALKALAPGGMILIRDIVMEESKTDPVSGALFAVNMLAATVGGGTFSWREFSEDLTQCGFINPRILRREEGMSSVIGAEKPR